MSSSSSPALRVVNLTKTFGGAQALKGISLEIVPGEIHALVGENGSGKSTFVKILSGYHSPESGGVVEVGGAALSFGDAEASQTAGLRFVHQDLGLIDELTCAENLAIGRGFDTAFGRRIRWRREHEAARAALASLGYEIDPRRPVGHLSVSERTAVAIARAVSVHGGQTHVVVLDEPTVNLPRAEIQRLFRLLRLLRDRGVALIFISHHLEEIFELADRVTVLRDGEVVATRPVSELDHDTLIEAMLGRALRTVRGDVRSDVGAAVLTVRGVSGEVVRDVDLTVRAGEVVGVAGITGSGRDELARLVGGGAPFVGHIDAGGQPLRPNRPDLFIRAGVVSVPAERKANAALPEHSVRENLTISDLTPYTRWKVLRRSAERSDVRTLLETFHIRPTLPEQPVDALSGGNQQKVMIARAMRLEPRVLVLDEPTQGVDVGAQAELHRLVRGSLATGLGVLACSSNSEELSEIADRVLIMRGGQVVDELTAPLSADDISAATLAKQKETS
ncbi:Ribose import ATP-binding protein RbsA 2 [Frankia canadensis]|uniref:Ribose import ATP-binding protein RbsA 2 n=1 Tax=Frankia canadensis TaxID=1836972 RepID=A0A2I2L2A9_9ACTN|nr:sugar ABC transporter ATP-binding protein [Frankia canadensis]SNQ52066.1 Ribose import ATP-binding protein RbsA 2 [Frankia canadensis]SOU59356.1 Ribose import ATP-binding protein RbsA 2 [Frankia canadensis]